MATTPHSNLTGADLHEPKGVSAATAQHVYVANGSGSGSWQLLNPYGSWRYNDIGTGTTFTAPTAYTLINMAGTAGSLNSFSYNNLGRLTYTAAGARHAHAVADITFKHSIGSGQDCYFAVYKNGSILGTPNAEIVKTADSGTFKTVAIHFDNMMAQNDYYEFYLKTSTGNIIVHSMYMFMMGMPG